MEVTCRIINSYKKLSSSTMKIVKLPLKDLNNEELPIYEKILQKIKGIKRDKIKNCQKRNVIMLFKLEHRCRKEEA